MINCRTMLTMALLLSVLTVACTMAGAQQKKLILSGWWTTQLPSEMLPQMGRLQDKPFDGMILRLKPTNPTVFQRTRWNEADLQKEYTALQQMRWGRYTDNFIVANCASDIDWFNDNDWASVLYNIGLVAKAARLGNCKGIAFDPESYPTWESSPWCYLIQPSHTTKTYNDYRVMLRKRGAQFLNVIKQQLPNPVIHIYFGYDLYAYEKLNPNVNSTRLDYHAWGMLHAFINGMLDAATPGTVINDGNEEAYYYKSAADYSNARYRILSTNAQYAAPDQAAKYRQYVRNAPALYPDYIFNQFEAPFTWKPVYSQYMTADEKKKWWEHNVYYSLSTANKYAWVYAEHARFADNLYIPDGLISGIVSAKKKIATGRPLGYSMDPIINRVKGYFPAQ